MATTATPARVVAIATMSLVVGGACESPPTVVSFSGQTMGTTYDVVVELSGAAVDTLVLDSLIKGELARLEDVMSTYLPESDVSRFGRFQGAEPMAVESSLVSIVAAALEVGRRSSGAFDPTVAPLVDAWGFGPAETTPPDSATVDSLRRHVDYARLVADSRTGTLAKADPRVRIDLSGIAKGFAAERLASRLAELGLRSALVDVGGELRALGTHVDGRPWRVAVEGPGASRPELLGTVDLTDEAIATSGDFRDFYEHAGVLYAHIIDPRSGFPIRFRGFSVTVVHDDGALADAWATALIVLGPEEGYRVAEREGLAAVLAVRSADGMTMRATSAMAGRVTRVE